jgi:hypothetical protein
MTTICSGAGTGSGRLNPLMTPKIAVFAPTPSASVNAAVTTNAGARQH